jgi:hypothetical protein
MRDRFLFSVSCLAFILFIAAAAAAPEFAGTWLGKTEVPDQGIDELSLVLKKGEAGYSGTITDSLGMIVKETELKDIKIKEKTMTFQFPLFDGTPITVKLTLDGDKMTGAWEHPEGSMGTIELERKK